MTFLADAPPKLTERAFSNDVVAYAGSRGWHVYYALGVPALVLIRRPRIVLVVLRADRTPTTPTQRGWLDDLRGCSIEAYLWRPRNWRAIEGILR